MPRNEREYVVVEDSTGIFWGTRHECDEFVAKIKKEDRVRALGLRIVSEKNYDRYVA